MSGNLTQPTIVLGNYKIIPNKDAVILAYPTVKINLYLPNLNSMLDGYQYSIRNEGDNTAVLIPYISQSIENLTSYDIPPLANITILANLKYRTWQIINEGSGSTFELTNKGDLLTSDGISSIVLDIGLDNYILTADSSANSGLSWKSRSDILQLTNKGDLLTSNGVNTAVLINGSDGQVLTVDTSQPLGIKWAATSGSLPLTTKGDTLVNNGTANVRQPVGTNNQIIIADSLQTNGLKWGNVSEILPLTTKGDLMVNNGTSNVRQSVGANNQIIIADSLQTNGIKWGNVSEILPLTTKGDLMVNTGTSNVRQPVGTNNQIIIADSLQTNGIKWGNVSEILPLTTKGDLMVNNGTSNVRQPVGTNDQVLIADSAQTTGVRWGSVSPALYKFSSSSYPVAQATSRTFTASEFIREEMFMILRSGTTGTVTDYTPTAASMVALLPVADRVVGHTRMFYYMNIDTNGSGSKFEFKSNSIDIIQPASVTIVNTNTTRAINNGMCIQVLMRFTNVSSGTEAAIMYLITATA